MSLPQYQFVLLNKAGVVVRVFDPPSSYDMRYSRLLNDVGAVAITFPSDVGDLFQKDYLLEILRTNPLSGSLHREDTFLVRLMHLFREGDEERFVVGGVSLEHFLMRRIIDPNDDPLAAGGYSTKAGPADTVMRDYIREQAADLARPSRRIPGLTVGPINGNGLPIGQRLRHDKLLKVLQDFAVRSLVDFKINRTTGYNFEVSIGVLGVDRRRSTNYPLTPWLGFDPQRGNLSDPSLLRDWRDEENYVYALGQGQGDHRIVLEMASTEVQNDPLNRIEFVEDVRQSDKADSLTLLTAAQAALQTKQAKMEFTFKPSTTQPGSAYRKDWDVGDYVTVRWRGVEQDLRIGGVEITIDGGGETIEPTVIPI